MKPRFRVFLNPSVWAQPSLDYPIAFTIEGFDETGAPAASIEGVTGFIMLDGGFDLPPAGDSLPLA